MYNIPIRRHSPETGYSFDTSPARDLSPWVKREALKARLTYEIAIYVCVYVGIPMRHLPASRHLFL